MEIWPQNMVPVSTKWSLLWLLFGITEGLSTGNKLWVKAPTLNIEKNKLYLAHQKMGGKLTSLKIKNCIGYHLSSISPNCWPQAVSFWDILGVESKLYHPLKFILVRLVILICDQNQPIKMNGYYI